MKNNDLAILLHRINYSDRSLIVTFFTENSGVQKFYYQVAKKKTAGLLPFTVYEIEYYKRPDSDLGKLTLLQPKQGLSFQIQLNPVKNSIAFLLTEIMRKCLHTDQSEPELFKFIRQTILTLQESEDTSFFMIQFLIDFANKLGIQPEISTQNELYFNLQDGEFTSVYTSDTILKKGIAVSLIQAIMRNDPLNIYAKKDRVEAFEILITYYKLHIPGFDVQRSLDIVRDVIYH